MSSKPSSSKSDPRVAPKDVMVTRHKSALMKRQLRTNNRSMKHLTNLLKSPTKETLTNAPKNVQAKPKTPKIKESLLKSVVKVQKLPEKVLTMSKIMRKKIALVQDEEYHPNKVKRKTDVKKVILKPSHDLQMVGSVTGSIKRKSTKPHKALSKRPKQVEIPENEELSMADVIRMVEDDLTDEDMMEILTCPSPVWWEDPPDEEYIEDAIFKQKPSENEPEIKTTEPVQVTKEVDVPTSSKEVIQPIEMPNLPTKSDNFLRKRSNLEILLGHLKRNDNKMHQSKMQMFNDDVIMCSNHRTHNNGDATKKIKNKDNVINEKTVDSSDDERLGVLNKTKGINEKPGVTHKRKRSEDKPGVAKKTKSSDEKPGVVKKTKSSDDKPGVVKNTKSSNEKPGVVKKTKSSDDKPGVVKKTKSRDEKPGVVKKTKSSDDKPGVIKKTKSRDEEHGVVKKTKNRDEKPGIVKKTKSSDEKHGVTHKRKSSDEKPSIVKKTKSSDEKPGVIHKRKSSDDKPGVIQKTKSSDEKPGVVKTTKSSGEKPGVTHVRISSDEKSGVTHIRISSNDKPGENHVVVHKRKSSNDKLGLINETESSDEKHGVINEKKISHNKPGVINETKSSNDEPGVINEIKSSDDKPVVINERKSSNDKPGVNNKTKSIDDKPGVINERKSSHDKPCVINERKSSDDKPGVINERKNSDDKTGVINERKSSDDKPGVINESKSSDVKTGVINERKSSDVKPGVKNKTRSNSDDSDVPKETKQNYDKRGRLSESDGDEILFDDSSMNEDELLRGLENMDIPIEHYKNNDVIVDIPIENHKNSEVIVIDDDDDQDTPDTDTETKSDISTTKDKKQALKRIFKPKKLTKKKFKWTKKNVPVSQICICSPNYLDSSITTTTNRETDTIPETTLRLLGEEENVKKITIGDEQTKNLSTDEADTSCVTVYKIIEEISDALKPDATVETSNLKLENQDDKSETIKDNYKKVYYKKVYTKKSKNIADKTDINKNDVSLKNDGDLELDICESCKPKVKKVSDDENVKYCLKCSSIFDSTECTYCLEKSKAQVFSCTTCSKKFCCEKNYKKHSEHGAHHSNTDQ